MSFLDDVYEHLKSLSNQLDQLFLESLAKLGTFRVSQCKG